MIELFVVTPPRVQLSLTINARPVALVSVISNGQSLRITCATWGSPRPSISWFKNGVLHLQSGRHHYTNKNSSRAYAAEDLFIQMIMFKDMVCSNYLLLNRDDRYGCSDDLYTSKSISVCGFQGLWTAFMFQGTVIVNFFSYYFTERKK